MKKKILLIIILCLIILGIIAIIVINNIRKKYKENILEETINTEANVQNEVDEKYAVKENRAGTTVNTTSVDTEDLDEESEDLAIDTSDLNDEYAVRSIVNNFLNFYALSHKGTRILYSEIEDDIYLTLNLYESEEEINTSLELTNAAIEINGSTYELYNTKKSFKEYKNECLYIMSEEVFEKYFTTYAQNVDGQLYIVKDMINENESFETLSVSRLDEKTFKVTCNYTDRINTEQREYTLTIETGNSGNKIITSINL